MNVDQRHKLDEAITRLEEAKEIVEAITSEEQDAYDELSEKAQEGASGDKLNNIISNLEEASGRIEDSIDAIGTARNT